MVLNTPVSESAEPSTNDVEASHIQREKNRAAIELLDSWLNETDPEVIREQRETWEFLKQALGEGRGSYRKLF